MPGGKRCKATKHHKKGEVFPKISIILIHSEPYQLVSFTFQDSVLLNNAFLWASTFEAVLCTDHDLCRYFQFEQSRNILPLLAELGGAVKDRNALILKAALWHQVVVLIR